MNIFSLAVKNLARRKIRTGLTMTGIALSAWVLLTLLGFNKGYEQALNHDIEGMGFQIVLTAKGCPYEAATLMLKGGTGLRYMPENLLNDILKAPEVAQATPMLMHAEFDPYKGENGGTSVYFGVDAKTYPPMKPYFEFEDGNWFSEPYAREIVLGYEAAELEQREVGDPMMLAGTDEEFRVVGILKRTGTQDDGMIFLPLRTLQQIFHKTDLLTMLGIRLKQGADTARFEEDLYRIPDVQVVSMAQVKNTIVSLVKSARVIVLSIACIAFIIAVFGVLNTVLMSVLERYGEIGILKSMGALPRHIFLMIWSETFLLCVGGCLFGLIGSFVFADLSERCIRYFLPFAPNGELIVFSWSFICTALGVLIVTGLLGGLLPAWRAALIRPLEAIRSEN
jgi:putative ABC transport system permease protein